MDDPSHDEKVSGNTTADEESPRSRRRGRSLPLGRKKESGSSPQVSPQVSRDDSKSDDASDVGSNSTEFHSAEEAPLDPKMSEDEVSQEHSVDESKSAEYMEVDEERTESTQVLEGVLPNGTSVTVSLIVNETPFENDELPRERGDDGNNFYCEICKDAGEIVCCDGCPKVFHPTCIPEGSPSRVSLDNDDDPWFCPDCLSENKGVSSNSSRRASKRMCSECRQSAGDNPLVPCEGCGVYLHHPSCRTQPEDVDEEIEEDSPVFCSNCAAGDVVAREEDELEQQDAEGDEIQDEPRRLRRRCASVDTTGSMDEEMSEEGDGGSKRRSKRKKSIGEESVTSTKKKKESAKERTSVKKRKKRKKQRSSPGIDDDASDRSGSPVYDERPFPRSYTAPRGLVKATPAFFFFVNDNRYKIERVLARKHRYFNRLPKGLERNQLIAREAAIWWDKLRPNDHRRYMNMSMRDFEERVVEWKEEKNLREIMMLDSQDSQDAEYDDGNQAMDLNPEDEHLTYDHHRRLYEDTSVGSKPFTPEPGKSNNRVLLELLQDMRFHPVPLLKADRSDEEPGQMEYSKMSIPYFEVHGPVATSVGDECLGCVRGWNHFCPVLKRRMPGIENRAKLQPPLSALMATRVGLGLRPRLPTASTEDTKVAAQEWRNADAFSERESTETKEAKQLPPISSYTLSQPGARADDIVNFVEGVTATKIPEPPLPSAQGSSSRWSMLSRGTLPMHGRKKRSHGSNTGPVLNKCGRCRTVIQNDTGCVQCRRAQLVINMSKQQSPKSGDGLLKVQTAMLGRLSTKDSNYDKQSEEDRAVSNAMLKMRWSPNAVLPPRRTLAPEHIPGSSVDDESSSDLEDASDEDASMDVSNEGPVASGLTDDGEGGGLATVEEQVTGNEDIVMSTSNETEGTPEVSEGRSSRSKRARRQPAFSTAEVEEAEADRRQIAKEHQEEASQLNKRCVSVASCGILLAMIRRDPLLLFAEPVPADVEAYTKIVPNPIDFGKIKSRVLNEEYKTLAAFVSDARRLCTNALAYNPVGTIYNKTAKELLDVLELMQKRASEWMTAIKNAHASSFAWRGAGSYTSHLLFDHDGRGMEDDPFRELRETWPEAVDILESGDWLKSQVAADFMRTRENETAYYGGLAIRRTAAAAEASWASYPDSGGAHNPVARRSHVEDEALRTMIDKNVAEAANPVELKDFPTWREESIIKMLRRVQTRRIEGRISSENGCARCDGIRIDQEAKVSTRADAVRWGRNKRKGEADTMPRVAASRISLSTGLGSSKNCEAAEKRQTEAADPEDLEDCIGEVGVSVQGSRIHGWGLFADQPFKPGDIVAEYVGEYVTHATADAREKMYQEQRIQDYQFRADELVVDATMKGGHGRYINHNCSPNCIAKIVEGNPPKKHLKRVIIIAQSNIKAREEITYDYQFPLELDLDARIPCNCGSESCRGFMNWDLPEKGSKNRITRGTKRGGNMRDRIRRLNRPRKRGDN